MLQYKTKITLFILLSSALISGLYFFLPHTAGNKSAEQTHKAETGNNIDETPTITLNNIRMVEREKKGDYLLETTAQEGCFNHKTGSVQCSGIQCKLSRSGTHYAQLNAKKAYVDRKKKDIFLQDTVTGSFEGVTFDGSNVHYNYANQQIQTGDRIIYRHDFFTHTAQHSHIDIQNKTITMTGGIKSEILYRAATNHRGH